ncbi:TPA: restriction endonuclease subunit S [Enterobacter kobei]|uniref:restriction endonuclease subunit S n=1 Tax=Gammaproteobacteria TaxID=1236 RepID=UPI0015DD5156|nr:MULTISPECIES: restriction endonuclease subunit S [Enterobacteriaceae]HCG3094989.1 restriction endonuclease subunit S [Klebsiella pneumoniae]HDS7687392.1 restriction endonuclease subunit S [Enterobacter kobei]ULJ36377.1 restriction endonuclease subunit S [Klebsiella quasipneumoniae]WCF42417.1 restriction endonuclease subunit S [Enterobacter roggenkampii]BBS50270.1 restriction endonuclease subunit S [Klebsiella quasipneumoniae]
MNGNKKQPLVPRLRFPEFRGAVSVLPLDAVADFVSEKFSVDQLTPAQYVSTENLLPDFGGISPATKLPSVSSVTSFRHRDILVSNIRPYLKKVWQSDMCGGVSNDVLVIRPTERVGADYLAAILRSDFFIDYVMRGAKGVKMPRGEISMIREFPVPNPCPEEQQRIADCLSSLDDLIAAETQKLDTLKTHKKGLMQQLFPREGETVPRLRFPEFREAGEWKIKSLGTVCTVLQGYGFPETLQGRTEGQYPFCKVSDISRSVAENGGFLAKAANYVNANDLATLRAKLIPIGATVFAKIGEALRLNRRAFVQCECLIDNNAVGLKAVPGVANDYFIYLLSQLINLNDHCGGAVPSVNKSTLEAIEVVVPEVDEQEKIAASMSYHDELIRNQEKKLGILKIHKAGLMQQLFPVLNGEQA